jgi:Flp pilus assembly pilin Flp
VRKLSISLSEEEDGVTAIEYGLIAALIGIFISLAVLSSGQSLNQLFFRLTDCLSFPRGPLC